MDLIDFVFLGIEPASVTSSENSREVTGRLEPGNPDSESMDVQGIEICD